jgi:hypothetical protein
MKKITYFFMLSVSLTFAQTSTNYLDTSINETEVSQDTNNSIALIVRAENGRAQIIDTYQTLGDFNTAVEANCSDTNLSSEDFSNGPGGITDCGLTVSDAGDGCFAAGELEAGFSVEASNGTTIVNIPPNSIGNTDSLVGAITFAEYTIINFSSGVYAVAMDIWENNDPLTVVRIFGTGSVLIDSFDVTTPVNSQTFFGVVSDELITSIEVEGTASSGELFGNFLFGADCMPLSVADNLQSVVSIFPNPADDNLFIKIPAVISITDVKIYDTLGKSIYVNIIDNQVNVSNLNGGVYFIKINTLQGSLTMKFVKK